MHEAAPAEAGAAAEKKRPLLRRVPTSLLVTLLGIALTAWLLPAFTRQWDDRQKAQEVRAKIGVQIAAATSRALMRSNAALETAGKQELDKSIFRPGHGPTYLAVQNADARLYSLWLRDRIAIEATLHGYLNSGAVSTALESYDGTMRALFSVSVFPWARWPADPVLANLTPDASVHGLPPREMARRLGLPSATLVRDLVDIRNSGPPDYRAFRRQVTFDDFARGVLRQQNALIDRIAEAHINGYSTTTHDLIHDLIP